MALVQLLPPVSTVGKQFTKELHHHGQRNHLSNIFGSTLKNRNQFCGAIANDYTHLVILVDQGTRILWAFLYVTSMPEHCDCSEVSSIGGWVCQNPKSSPRWPCSRTVLYSPPYFILPYCYLPFKSREWKEKHWNQEDGSPGTLAAESLQLIGLHDVMLCCSLHSTDSCGARSRTLNYWLLPCFPRNWCVKLCLRPFRFYQVPLKTL